MKLIINFYGTWDGWQERLSQNADKKLVYIPYSRLDEKYQKVAQEKFTGSDAQIEAIKSNPEVLRMVALQGSTFLPNTISSVQFNNSDKIGVLNINGCQYSDVGGWRGPAGWIAPNLNHIIEKLATLLSSTLEADWNSVFQTQLGNGYAGYTGPDHGPIESLILYGYSRGAITCYGLAKKLQEKNIPIPISFIANQPVPGVSHYSSEVHYYGDLTQCQNIENAVLLLSACDKKQANTFQNTFFTQLIPSFHASTTVNAHKTPAAYHVFSDIDEYYIEHYLAKWLGITINSALKCDPQKQLLCSEKLIRRYYSMDLFTPDDQLQDFFLIGKGCDAAHDARGILRGLFPLKAIDNSAAFRTDSETHCLHCEATLIRGSRGHCRLCGRGYFCINCSSRRLDYNNQRVCNACYDQRFPIDRKYDGESTFSTPSTVCVMENCAETAAKAQNTCTRCKKGAFCTLHLKAYGRYQNRLVCDSCLLKDIFAPNSLVQEDDFLNRYQKISEYIHARTHAKPSGYKTLQNLASSLQKCAGKKCARTLDSTDKDSKHCDICRKGKFCSWCITRANKDSAKICIDCNINLTTYLRSSSTFMLLLPN